MSQVPATVRAVYGRVYAVAVTGVHGHVISVEASVGRGLPTLVLAGDDDPIVPLANGRILTGLLPDGRLKIIRGGGHLFLLERPAEIAALVAAFLTGDGSGAI